MVEGIGVIVERAADEVRILVSGTLDLQTAPRLLASVRACGLQDGAQLILDLAAVAFMDSSGLAALLGVYEHHGERLRIVAPGVETAIALSGARSFLPFADPPANGRGAIACSCATSEKFGA